MKISAVVLTKNEEQRLGECVNSLRFCDQIVVVDDFSEDGTVALAKRLGANLFQRKLNSDYASQRNFGLRKAGGDWVLFVDADEIVSKELGRAILKATKKAECNGYYLKRVNYLHNKIVSQEKLLRLARKNVGKWRRAVHEEWVIEGKVRELEGDLLHYSFEKGLTNFLTKLNEYSALHAQENLREKKKVYFLKLVFWPVAKFVALFRGGSESFVFAVLASFHSFLVWSALWLTKNKN